jgi:hypothetical protein
MKECLGVDLGNVIIDHLGFGTTPEFFRSGDYNIIPPVPGVFEALRMLNERRFGSEIFVVYNATDVADQKITSWLQAHDFFARTGILPDRVKRTQNGRNKLSVCQMFGATHFVDDRLEVLSHLIGKVENLYLLRPQQIEVGQYKEFIDSVSQFDTWENLARFMIT